MVTIHVVSCLSKLTNPTLNVATNSLPNPPDLVSYQYYYPSPIH